VLVKNKSLFHETTAQQERGNAIMLTIEKASRDKQPSRKQKFRRLKLWMKKIVDIEAF